MGILSLTYITKLSVCVCIYIMYIYIYIPRAEMTSIFENQPFKTSPLQTKINVYWSCPHSLNSLQFRFIATPS